MVVLLEVLSEVLLGILLGVISGTLSWVLLEVYTDIGLVSPTKNENILKGHTMGTPNFKSK